MYFSRGVSGYVIQTSGEKTVDPGRVGANTL